MRNCRAPVEFWMISLAQLVTGWQKRIKTEIRLETVFILELAARVECWNLPQFQFSLLLLQKQNSNKN